MSNFEIPVEMNLGQAAPPSLLNFDPSLLRVVFGGGEPPPADPMVGLRVKIAKARQDRLERKRQIDTATMPYVQAEIVQSEKQTLDIQAKIDEALQVLKTPPPVQQTGMNEAEMWTAGIGALLSPGNIPQVLNALAQSSGARNDREFDDKLREYGLTRETTVMALRQLVDQLGRSQGQTEDLKKEERGIRAYGLKSEAEIEDWYDNALLDVEQMATKYGIEVEEQKKQLAAKREKDLLDAETERKKIAADALKDKANAENQKRDDARADRQLNETIRHNKASEGTAAKREDRIAKSEIGGKSFFTPSDLKSVQKQIITARANLKAAEAGQRTKGGSAWDKIVSRVSGKPMADSAKVAEARAKLEALENELAGMRGEGPANPFDFDPGLKDKVKPGEPYKDAKGIWRQR